MEITKKDLENSQVELTIEVPQEEMKSHLENAAQRLSQKNKIPGFRPGKAPYELIKQRFGDMTIYQEALDNIITESFYKAVTREKLETIGQPEIKIEKLAPENPVVYKAIVALIPKVSLGTWQNISVKKKEAKATEEDINKTIDQLREMNVKEAIVDRKAEEGDKVEVDFEISINKALVEGGKSSKYPVVIGKKQMVPGFEEKLVGLKAGQETEFELQFPPKYFKENMAGKKADFKVKILNVYKRDLPKADDAFAKTIGFETMEKLKSQLKDNITRDKEMKEKQRVEAEAVNEIVKISQIGDIPEVLIKNETAKMAHELEHSIMQQGMDMAGYLKSINKTHEDLEKDFRPQALERLKAALVLRQLAQEEKVQTSNQELDEELKKQEEMYKDNKEILQNIKNPAYRQHIANVLTNQKIVKFLSEKIIK